MCLAMTDTIIAIATPPQNGAIGILRLSGPLAKTEALKFFRDSQGQKIFHPKPRHFLFGHLVNEHEQILDDCLVVFMSGPNSYTGEDVVEFHCHGNLLLLKKILKLFLEHTDIRAAEPGEFTKRAFLNGRMDLAQAESVHEIITAGSEASLKASLKNLDGRLSKIIHNMRDQFKTALALVEASFEFSEEDIQTFDRNEVLALLKKSHENLLQLEQAYQTSKLYDYGVSVAIVGPPNVGKSSLLNALMVEERAIVTEIPGTTRDVIEGSRMIEGVRFIFRDTAGLRETQDVVESAGIRRSQEWIEKSDIVLFVTDECRGGVLTRPLSGQVLNLSLPDKNIFHVFNKIDLVLGEAPDPTETEKLCHKHHFDAAISAKTGFGLQKIETLLLSNLEKKDSPENVIHVNERQRHAIERSIEVVEKLLTLPHEGLEQEELLAEELRHVIRHLEEITGEVTNEEVLGEIFQRFCIGK